MLNYSFIAEKAKTSHIDDLTIEREYWQLLFLQRLYLTKTSETVFFKGGTAVRFLFGSFRFSEDLDFTSINSKAKTENLIKEIFSFFKKNTKIEMELKKEEMPPSLKNVSTKFRFLLTTPKARQKVSIRIDISYREKPLTKQESVLVPFDYPISPYPLVVHLMSKEILAEKIRALFIRSKPRDLFDVWFLLTKRVDFDKRMIEKKLKLYPEIHFDLSELVKKIKSYEEKELRQDLNQFLPENYRHFYKTLKQETLKLFKEKVSLGLKGNKP